MTDTKYNGWTNYATWRINLEMIDDQKDHYMDEIKDLLDVTSPPLNELKLTVAVYEMIKQDVNHLLECELHEPENSFVLNYAMAFVDECNFWEIADHLIMDYWNEYHEAV